MSLRQYSVTQKKVADEGLSKLTRIHQDKVKLPLRPLKRPHGAGDPGVD